MNKRVSFKEKNGQDIYWIDAKNKITVTSHPINTKWKDILREKSANIIQNYWNRIRACINDIQKLKEMKRLKHQWLEKYHPEFCHLLYFANKHSNFRKNLKDIDKKSCNLTILYEYTLLNIKYKKLLDKEKFE
jgi:hypothetical protein